MTCKTDLVLFLAKVKVWEQEKNSYKNTNQYFNKFYKRSTSSRPMCSVWSVKDWQINTMVLKLVLIRKRKTSVDVGSSMHTGRKKWKANPEVTTQSFATRLICYVSFSPDLCRTASEHPLHRQLARVVKVLKYTQIWPQCKYKHWQLHLFLTVLLYLRQLYNHLKILPSLKLGL